MKSSKTTNPAKLLQEIYSLTHQKADDRNNKKKGARDSDSPQVDGKEKRVRLAPGCGETIFKLCKALGHRSAGQTVEWLLGQAKAPVEAALAPTKKTTNSRRPPLRRRPPPPAPLVVDHHSNDPLPLFPRPPPSPPVVDPHSNDPLPFLLLPPPSPPFADPLPFLLLPPPSPPVSDPLPPLTPPPPPAPPVVDPFPNYPFSPPPMRAPVPAFPPATIVPIFNELPSATVVAGNNARMPAPIARPKPVLASRKSRHNRAGDEVEISADAVARFLYGPRP